MATTKELVGDLEAFKETPQNPGYDLRLDLADIILRHVDGRSITQKQLAEAARMKQSFITRIVHSDSNCTFDVAGRILHALGVKARLIEDKQINPAHAAPFQVSVVITGYVGSNIPGIENVQEGTNKEVSYIHTTNTSSSGYISQFT